MTEAEWQTCKWVAFMQRHLRQVKTPVSDRKIRLWGVACCRRVQHLIDIRFEVAVDIAERYADADISRKDLDATRKRFVVLLKDLEQTMTDRALVSACEAAKDIVIGSARKAAPHAAFRAATAAALAGSPRSEKLTNESFAAFSSSVDDHMHDQAPLFRDVVGNPFRPVVVDPPWRTNRVVGMAQAIYTDRAFDRLPILADALEEAGCTNAELLAHCRGPGPHVRGCWAVDLLLGKE